MRPVSFHSDILVRLLQHQKIATMDEMKAALGTAVDMTVFRKLRGIPYHSSYSHRGKYYVLDKVARFDDRGLWSFHEIHFSRFGSLVDTAFEFVDRSDQGFVVPELAGELHVPVQQPLLQLVRSGRLARETMSGLYVYCSADSGKRRRQLLRRRELEIPSSPGEPFALTSDEARAAVILFYSLLDERQRRLYAGSESMKLGRGGDRLMAEWTGLSRQTIARGRRELLQRDQELDRIRQSGAGRIPVEKKRRK